MNHIDNPLSENAQAERTSTPQTLRERLMRRVQLSHAHESQFHTVRRDAGLWRQAQADVRAKALASTAVARSALLDIAPGASFEQRGDAAQQEVVLLGGQLFVGIEALEVGDAICAPNDAAHVLRAGGPAPGSTFG